MLIGKVKETIRKYRMLSRGDRVVMAVSGGPDSVCLLLVLHALAKDLDPPDDVQATGAVKRRLAGVLLKRVAAGLMGNAS